MVDLERETEAGEVVAVLGNGSGGSMAAAVLGRRRQLEQ